MYKNIFLLLMANIIFLTFVVFSSSQIIVEDAREVWYTQLSPVSVPDIPSPIAVEYASFLKDENLICPTDLILISQSVRPRVVVEYATFVSQIDTKIPPCKGDVDGDGDVDGFDLYMHTINLDELPLIILCTSIGRDNCLICNPR